MKRLLAGLAAAIGLWLAASPWFLGYASTEARLHDTVMGLLVAVLGLITLAARDPGPRRTLLVAWFAGIWLLVSGLAVLGAVGGVTRLNECVAGLFIVATTSAALQLPSGHKAFVYTKDGKVLLELERVMRRRGSLDVELKGKVFGSMPQTMYVRPIDVWYLSGLLPFEVLRGLPRLLWTGWRASRQSDRSGRGATSSPGAAKAPQ